MNNPLNKNYGDIAAAKWLRLLPSRVGEITGQGWQLIKREAFETLMIKDFTCSPGEQDVFTR